MESLFSSSRADKPRPLGVIDQPVETALSAEVWSAPDVWGRNKKGGKRRRKGKGSGLVRNNLSFSLWVKGPCQPSF